MRRGGAAASSNNKEAPTFYGVPPLFTIYNLSFPSVSLKEIPGIHLIPHIIQHFVVAVGDDGLALFFELLHIIHHISIMESPCF